ncbi:hypothetical protein CDCA_CDCA04G1191 [Cyanidium caldarium]|uniref:Uncharacterized protein n=1 Tax=Cyanidium caldarium TaxID=2771 RepID=A0AAV9ISY0_CYACA|nr:hypothetical protein CDCA_CDCA04G1191 [Cyanidium caldarium]
MAYRITLLPIFLLLASLLPPLRILALPLALRATHPTSHTDNLNENVAMTLNYTQFDYTLANALHKINPKICLNYDLTIAAENVADLLPSCTVDEVGADNCSSLTASSVREAFASAGWNSSDVQGVQLAASLPARDFNFTYGEGLVGRTGYEQGLRAAPQVVSKLRPYLEARRLNLAGVGSVSLLDDKVYAFVVIGEGGGQKCYGDEAGQPLYDFGGDSYIT